MQTYSELFQHDWWLKTLSVKLCGCDVKGHHLIHSLTDPLFLHPQPLTFHPHVSPWLVPSPGACLKGGTQSCGERVEDLSRVQSC